MTQPIRRPAWIGAFVAIFAFRLWYGLSMPFWSEDERQVYLIGLRSFARGEWPYFGADVVWNGSQLAGALQALLIRSALAIWPAPEAPFVFLNLISFAALAALAWYFVRRFHDVPRWLIVGLVFLCPWTLNFSAHVINTSYILPGAVAFFIGFFEGLPAFRRGLVPLAVAWASMGFGLVWMMQIHMSWVVLPAYVIAAAIGVMTEQSGARKMIPGFGFFLVGAAIPGVLLLPTLMRYGLAAVGLTGAIAWHWQSPFDLITTAARVLSFSSWEILRFLGLTRAERVLTIWREPWIVPFLLLVLTAGVVQPIWVVVTSIRRLKPTPGVDLRIAAADWRNVRILVVATVVLIYASYFLSIRGQQAHAFYVVFPISAFFALSCWQVCARAGGDRWRRWERVAMAVIGAGVVVHVGLAVDRWSGLSLYANRPLVVSAITDHNDRYLGDRRDTIYATEDHRPRPVDHVSDSDAYLAARATDDLRVIRADWRPVDVPLLGRVSVFSVAITNGGREIAWLDLRFEVIFSGADGQRVAMHEGVIKEILQPGEARAWPDLPAGMVPFGATSASFRLTGAERAIPCFRCSY